MIIHNPMIYIQFIHNLWLHNIGYFGVGGMIWHGPFLLLVREEFKKKNREYNEFGTKGGGVSDLNHYLKQL